MGTNPILPFKKNYMCANHAWIGDKNNFKVICGQIMGVIAFFLSFYCQNLYAGLDIEYTILQFVNILDKWEGCLSSQPIETDSFNAT